MKIGIYGGTFNPPHVGHIKAAGDAVKALGLDKLLVVPTAQPPHKELPEASPTAEQRLEMAGLAFAGVEKAEVCDIELTRGGRSYTVDTVKALREIYPGDELWLIMGGDMFYSLTEWYRFEELLNEVGFAVADRADESEKLKEYAGRMRRDWAAKVEFIPERPIEISSTELRRKIANAEGRELLAPEVYAYIVKNRLYGVKPQLDWLREEAIKLLAPKRVAHVMGCEQEAVRLAERWGEDVYSAAAAGILHDITKKCSTKEQLILCEKYGTVTDTLELEAPKLLHSKTAADMAWAEFGISPEVREAIRWHTTGRPGMTLLEKIIYIADYMEPNRDFEGVEELRRLAYEDIDRALCLGLRMSIEDMKARNIVPHPRSSGALEYIENNLKEHGL
ncbi:MAG: nicotinate (nicotinamide) nucleotide adenylyltransferase [Clostridiales bacterium]|nr:nicotinate (nicotinamide) nucleotide adenylyltransferase [Clostridiales bacterium]